MTSSRTRQRLVIIGVFAIFLLPILAAMVMNATDRQWLPFGTRNHGALIRPPPLVPAASLKAVDGRPWHRDSFGDRWTIALRTALPCDESCVRVIETTLRARLALGDDIDRVQVVLTLDRTPQSDEVRELLSRYAGIRVLAPIEILDTALSKFVPQPGFAVIDPQEFLILSYPPAATATSLLRDLQRLLRLSTQH